MAYIDEIKKTEMTEFAELFEITAGTTIYRYTSFHQAVTFQGHEYEPKPISRTPFSVDQEFKSLTVNITVPLIGPALAMVANYPIEPIKIKIYRAVKSDTSLFRLVFSGILKPILVESKEATLTAESLSDIFKTPVPSIIIQAPCNHMVFDAGCRLDAENFRVDATVTVNGATLVAGAFAANPDGWFTNGHVSVGGDFRLITNHVGDTLTLQAPFDDRLQSGGTVSAYAGCDKNPETCRDKFSNLENFLGMPYVPSKNPAISGF